MNRATVSRIAAVLVLAGCASASGPDFHLEVAPADKAVVYVYRPDKDFFKPGYPEVFVNGEKKFALRNNGYGVVVLPPGEYEIRFEGGALRTNWAPPAVSRKIGVQAGREYFIRAFPEAATGARSAGAILANSRTNVALVPREEALREISAVKLVTE